MFRLTSSRSKVAGLAAVLVAAVLAGLAGLAGLRGAERTVPVLAGPAESAGGDPVEPGRRAAGRTTAGQAPSEARSRADEPDEGAPGEPEPEEESRLHQAAMRRAVVDLEYNAGLPEPRQQNVVPGPAPWRPDPSAEAGPRPVILEVIPRSAPASGGTRVIIRGRNLEAVQVMFGLAPARILGASGEQVTVVAPPAAPGEVTIAVTNLDGNYALANLPFTYGR